LKNVQFNEKKGVVTPARQRLEYIQEIGLQNSESARSRNLEKSTQRKKEATRAGEGTGN
jgi:hypothetical protein